MGKMPDHSLYKILAHPERYAILRRLMASRATLTQLGEHFEKSPANIRHHLKLLEQAGLVAFVGERTIQGGPERYYRATERAIFIHDAVLPAVPPGKTAITIGSMDPGIQRLAAMLSEGQNEIFLNLVHLSSLEGLIALRQGLCQMTTCHLIDPQTGQFNRPTVRHLFPGQAMALVQVYRREEGLLVKSGNPLGIRSLEDLRRPGVRFVNREPGSGVRQWLDLHLQRLDIQPEAVSGYSYVVHSHPEVAGAIRSGQADAGLGIAASALGHGLDFIPLYEEPYEIAVPHSLIADTRYAPLWDYLNSGAYRTAVRGLGGYVIPPHSGQIDVIEGIA